MPIYFLGILKGDVKNVCFLMGEVRILVQLQIITKKYNSLSLSFSTNMQLLPDFTLIFFITAGIRGMNFQMNISTVTPFMQNIGEWLEIMIRCRLHNYSLHTSTSMTWLLEQVVKYLFLQDRFYSKGGSHSCLFCLAFNKNLLLSFKAQF